MSSLLCFMNVNLTLPAAPLLFATDARGPSDLGSSDPGGFGIVATTLTKTQALDVWRSSFTPGKTVTKLDGSMGRLSVRASMKPTIPFTRLPSSIFTNKWQVLSFGNWKFADHITAGEARAHWKCIQCLASRPDTHSHRFAVLQDNMPTAAAMNKGRACAPLLNYYCRRRAATNLAANFMSAAPWVQTGLQPADAASRNMFKDYHGAAPEHWPEAHGSPCPPKISRPFTSAVQESFVGVPNIHH